MDKYVWAECPDECWPTLKSIQARSYQDALERVINHYTEYFDDDKIGNCENISQLQGYLWDYHEVAISDIEIIDEL